LFHLAAFSFVCRQNKHQQTKTNSHSICAFIFVSTDVVTLQINLRPKVSGLIYKLLCHPERNGGQRKISAVRRRSRSFVPQSCAQDGIEPTLSITSDWFGCLVEERMLPAIGSQAREKLGSTTWCFWLKQILQQSPTSKRAN
jgi:hypothetical protein